MNDIAKGLELLIETIAKELKHQDYNHVTELADTYHDIFTGQGIEPYLKKYRANQDDKQFKQALEIYESTIPSVVHNLDTIFEKPLRSNRVYASVEHDNNAAKEEIIDRMQNFWQGETESGLDAYIRERWKYLNLYDPNAFIAVEFENFDHLKEKTYPFAVEYSSKEAIHYNFIKGVLDWLICEKQIKYKKPVGDKFEWLDGSKYIMYLENDAIVFTEVDAQSRLTDIPNPVFQEIKKDGQAEPFRVFVVQTFNLKSDTVPAFRVGYLQDAVTRARTVVSNIHHALPFFKKELKSGMELDLTIRAHVFPQKFMYGPKCEGDKEHAKPCQNGKTNNGDTCEVCKGTGTIPVHTTATDLVVLPFPKNANDPIMDLRQAMAYFSPPMDLVKFMEAYCDRLTEKAKGAIFPSQVIASSKNTLGEGKEGEATTATEQDYSWDNVYDALRKFTDKYSYCWLFITRMIATYTDNQSEGLVLYHKFPRDFKMKSVQQLLKEAQASDQSSLPQYIKDAIHNDIADIYYADDPDTLTKLKIKEKFYPFSGKSDAEIARIMNMEEILPLYKLLYIYFDIIFDAIDEEIGDKFYVWPYEKQKAEIEKRVMELEVKVGELKIQKFNEAKKQLQVTPAPQFN